MSVDLYADFLGSLAQRVICLSNKGEAVHQLPLADGIAASTAIMRVTRSERVKALLFGNGGSLTIADHIANDFNQCAQWRSMALSNTANMAAISNDCRFEESFAKQIEWVGRRGDIAIAISCSGKSENIVRAASRARAMGMALITLSAFQVDNPLAALGDVNFWVDTSHMGLAQVAHLVILHAVCDIGANEAGPEKGAANV